MKARARLGASEKVRSTPRIWVITSPPKPAPAFSARVTVK